MEKKKSKDREAIHNADDNPPREAAWRRQFPSPVVARGHSRCDAPTSAHQLRRPAPSRETKVDVSIRSRSRNIRNSSVQANKNINHIDAILKHCFPTLHLPEWRPLMITIISLQLFIPLLLLLVIIRLILFTIPFTIE